MRGRAGRREGWARRWLFRERAYDDGAERGDVAAVKGFFRYVRERTGTEDRVLWKGRPGRRLLPLTAGDGITVAVCLAMAGLFAWWGVKTEGITKPGTDFPLWRALFVVAFLSVPFKTVLDRLSDHRARIYLVTDSYVVNAGTLSTTVTRIDPETLGEVEVERVHADGTGTIAYGREGDALGRRRLERVPYPEGVRGILLDAARRNADGFDRGETESC